ncbi:MAG: 2,3-dehydroadipyl-CoA hydratase [Pseudorhodobacter sp.]|nr:MAG: 2,3-dehydroadipyl-CoA hydratase [Pseudorhodobacter sp.]
MEQVIIQDMGAWVKITLNRPEAKNALNTAVLGAVAAALTAAGANPLVRAALLCGANGNFAAGADISEIETKTAAEGAVDPRKAHWAAIRAFPKPLVAAVDGFALGGGFELALMADMIVLGADAKLGLPETNLGIIPGAGGAQRLLALVGRARATRLVLGGEIIDAATAYAWGIAGWLAEGPALPDAEALIARMCKRAPLALQAAKATLVAGDEKALALHEERLAFEALLDSADKSEGIRAFREKRKPEFKGA